MIRTVRLRLTLEYDGSRFRGWAAQPNLRTVEAVLREALNWVYGGHENLAVAGRTDTGVHALGQVVTDDVSVIRAEEAPRDFHARHSARGRTYRYRIWRRKTPSPFERRRSYWYPKQLDYEALADCADLLIGEHDF